MRLPAAFALAAILPLASCDSGTAPSSVPVTAGGKTFQCRLAITDEARERGLGGVTELAPDEGMIFVFTDSAPRSFWMRDCVIGLDIAYIDPMGFVTAVHTMPAEPLQAADESEVSYFSRLKRYPSMGAAQFVLEVSPGTLGPLGVKRGSRIDFDRDALKKLAR
jgi:uncharacterized membrane protein (UPF0127 family)